MATLSASDRGGCAIAGVKLIPFPVQSDAEIERAFTGFATEPNGAIIAVSVGDCCATLRKDHSLVLAFCNTEAMQLHLDEISTKVSARAHAILILDQAGWHGAKELRIPSNLSLLPLPPRAPELNSQETEYFCADFSQRPRLCMAPRTNKRGGASVL